MRLRADDRYPLALLAGVVVVGAWSAWKPFDLLTWVLEVAPLLAAIPILFATRRSFPLTNLAYTLIAVHGVVLMVGGHYTYALVPAGDWVKEWLDLSRNHYDRLGHVMQGFGPAILVREFIARRSPVRLPGHAGWALFFTTSICLSIAACYEFLEWAVAIWGPDEQGIAFLATQGDEWDTQWDMFLCFVGALASQLLLGPLHDRMLARSTRTSAKVD
jgi:putative membrane protein